MSPLSRMNEMTIGGQVGSAATMKIPAHFLMIVVLVLVSPDGVTVRSWVVVLC